MFLKERRRQVEQRGRCELTENSPRVRQTDFPATAEEDKAAVLTWRVSAAVYSEPHGSKSVGRMQEKLCERNGRRTRWTWLEKGRTRSSVVQDLDDAVLDFMKGRSRVEGVFLEASETVAMGKRKRRRNRRSRSARQLVTL